jgi:hypothetical protein
VALAYRLATHAPKSDALIEGLLLQNELFDEITGLAGASVLLTSTVIPGEKFVVEKRKAINEIKV